jgi:hypothetical protein
MLLIAASFAGCNGMPNIASTAQQRGSDVVFNIDAKGIEGLLDIMVWQAGEKHPLWYVNLNSYTPLKLTYGDLPQSFKAPNGQILRITQAIPLHNAKPAVFPAGKTFYLALSAEYDEFPDGPSSIEFYFSFITDSFGQISDFHSVPSPASSEIPEIKDAERLK